MWVFNANVLNGTLIDNNIQQDDGNLIATDVCRGTLSSALIVGIRYSEVPEGPNTLRCRCPFSRGCTSLELLLRTSTRCPR
jgi:hypothetical protein